MAREAAKQQFNTFLPAATAELLTVDEKRAVGVHSDCHRSPERPDTFFKAADPDGGDRPQHLRVFLRCSQLWEKI